jgi:hypothetical protein
MAFRLGGFVLAGSFYLLLIDTTDLPELYAGVGACALAAAAFEVSREQGFAEVSISPLWLTGAWRLVLRVPADIARVSVMAVRQAVAPRPVRGTLRAVPFGACGDDSSDVGRRALAEALGSLAPNTIVIGVDLERHLILAHQLAPGGGTDAVDVLELG